MPGLETEQRKLAAIMFTDMVGFSALAQRNEARAIELLEEHRRIVRAILPKHGGREVKTTGDGFLIEYPSALAALLCAVEIQQAMHERNATVSPENIVRIRVGIHVGDVIPNQGDIHGDGVNIAARLEPLAPPGGICISNAVWEQVRNKVDHPLALLGPAELKNIKLPMMVHRVVMPWESVATAPPVPKHGNSIPIIAVAVVLLVALVVIMLLKRHGAASADANNHLFTTSFASPAYQPGLLVGQQGWTTADGISLAAARVIAAGSGQHLVISGSAIERDRSNVLSGYFMQPLTNAPQESGAMRMSVSADVLFRPGSAFARPGFTIAVLTLTDEKLNPYAAIGFGKNSKIFGQNFARPTNQIVWADSSGVVVRHLRADFDFPTHTASFTVDGASFGQTPFNPLSTGRPAYVTIALQSDHPIDSTFEVDSLTVSAVPVSAQ